MKFLRTLFVFLGAALLLIGSTGCNPTAAMIPKAPDPEEIEPFDISQVQLFYTLTLEQTDALLKNHPETVIVDIRTPNEFAKGHLPGALNFDVRSDGFRQEIQSVDQGAKILVYGTAEQKRADSAINKMKSIGFQQVHRISDGYAAWQESGRPFIQDIP